MLLPHWRYFIFGFLPSFTHFSTFSHLFAHFHHIHSLLGSPHHGDPKKA